MGLVVTTPATTGAVSLKDAKAHLRVDTDDEDATILALVDAATRHYQTVTRRQLVNATFKLTIDEWPTASWTEDPYAYAIRIPRAPLSSVSSVKYIDTNGTQQTLSASVYESDMAVEPGVVRLKYGQGWPSTRSQKDAIEVNFVAGYGTSDASVPDDHRAAIKLLVAHWYENREASISGTIIAEVPLAFKALVMSTRILEAV